MKIILLLSIVFLARCSSQKSLIKIIEEDRALLIKLEKINTDFLAIKDKSSYQLEENEAQPNIQQLDEAIVLLKGRLERNSKLVFSIHVKDSTSKKKYIEKHRIERNSRIISPPHINDRKSIQKYIGSLLTQTPKSKADSLKKNKN